MGLEQRRTELGSGIKIGPDGEFTGSIEEITMQSATTCEVGDKLVNSEAEKLQSMLVVMDTLEKSNTRGLPSLYVTLGRGVDREVIMTIPQIKKPEAEELIGVESFYLVRYLVINKTGYSVMQTNQILDESRIEEYQDPLRFNAGDSSHRRLRLNVTDSKSVDELIRRTSSRCEIKPIEADEAWLIFKEINDTVTQRFSEAISVNRSVIKVSQKIRDENNLVEMEKPKRKRGLNIFNKKGDFEF